MDPLRKIFEESTVKDLLGKNCGAEGGEGAVGDVKVILLGPGRNREEGGT